MKIKYKKLSENAVLPKHANDGDAGVDLVATSKTIGTSEDGKPVYHYIEYGTSLAVEIPNGYVGLLFPRSSVSKTGLHLANSVGVIDSSYRGEIKVRFKLDAVSSLTVKEDPLASPALYDIGDRVAQLVIIPYVKQTPVETDSLSDTERGEGGFGSTGK